MTLCVEMVDNGDFFLAIFYVRFSVGESGVQKSCSFSDILHVTFFA